MRVVRQVPGGQMTPRSLARQIQKLSSEGPETDRLTAALSPGGPARLPWYSTQKEHWLGWLAEYDGHGAYGRKTLKGRSAEFAYNHIQCAPMLLWLAEASGVAHLVLRRAAAAVLAAGPRHASQCATLRVVIPWATIENALGARPLDQ